MAYENLELIVVFNGTRAEFLANGKVESSYYNKFILVTGGLTKDSNNNTTNVAKDPYLYVVDNEGNYRELNIPSTWISSIKIGDSSPVAGSFTMIGANGIDVRLDGSTITIDAATLQQLAANASTNANTAGLTASAALELAQQNKKDIAALTGDDSGNTITDIAKEEVEKLRKQVYGDDHAELEAYETIPSLRDEIDRIDEAYKVTIKKEGNAYIIMQDGQYLSPAIDIPKDMVVESGAVVKGNWSNDTFTEDASGTGYAIKLVIANSNSPALYINVANLVDTYTGSDGEEIKVTVNGYEISASLQKLSVKSSNLVDNAVTTPKIFDKNVTKAKLAQGVQDSLDLADSAVQEISSTSDFIVATPSLTTDGKVVYEVSPLTATMENVSKSDEITGLAIAEDVYAFIKARLSVKVVD